MKHWRQGACGLSEGEASQGAPREGVHSSSGLECSMGRQRDSGMAARPRVCVGGQAGDVHPLALCSMQWPPLAASSRGSTWGPMALGQPGQLLGTPSMAAWPEDPGYTTTQLAQSVPGGHSPACTSAYAESQAVALTTIPVSCRGLPYPLLHRSGLRGDSAVPHRARHWPAPAQGQHGGVDSHLPLPGWSG